jgi:hypothetical protein
MQAAGEFQITIAEWQPLPRSVSMRVDVCLRRPNIDSPRSAIADRHSIHTTAAPVPNHADSTDFDQKLFGFHAWGHVISSSMFSRYRKVKVISRRLPPESVAKSARPGLAIDFAVHRQHHHTTHHRIRLHGWTSVTRIRNLFAVAVATYAPAVIFTSAEFAFWVTDAPEKGQFLVGPRYLSLQIADRALHFLRVRGFVLPSTIPSCATLARSSDIVASCVGDLCDPGTLFEARRRHRNRRGYLPNSKHAVHAAARSRATAARWRSSGARARRS